MGKRSLNYDAFVSHAVEDKIGITNELCERLEKAGLKIWYSGSELGIGDSIERSVYKGLDESAFAIVVISPQYLEKKWPMHELHALLYKETKGEQKILPVLHNITFSELVVRFPFMADRWCVSSSKGIGQVADEIVRKIYENRPLETTSTKSLRRLGIPVTIAVALVLVYIGYAGFGRPEVPAEIITKEVEDRIKLVDQAIRNARIGQLQRSGAVSVETEAIKSIYNAYQAQQSYYRNEYEFNNGFTIIRAKKNVQKALALSVTSLTPETTYGMPLASFYLLGSKEAGDVRYAIVNGEKASFRIGESTMINDSTFTVDIVYETNNIRYIEVSLDFAESTRGTRRHTMTLWGFLPTETLRFLFRQNRWVLTDVK